MAGAENAGMYLSLIPARAKCSNDAGKLMQEIKQRLNEVDRRDWGFGMLRWKDNVSLQKLYI